MAYSPMARALLWLSPLIVVAGCRDDTYGTPDASVPPGSSSTSSASSSGSTEPAPSGPETLVISEVRSHGAGGDGYGDDFIELYNTGDEPITLDAAWKVHQQSAQGAACQGLLTNFVGQGQVIPPHHHFLLGGWEYGTADSATPAADTPLLMSSVEFSLADAGAIWVLHGTKAIDALCFYYDDATKSAFNQTCATPYVCKGTPVNNLPHDGSSQAASSVNVSLERKPTSGSLQNTGDNAADFRNATPATPQNLQSAAGP